MHIFLTGPRGIGKTTVIKRTIGLLAEHVTRTCGRRVALGGFVTYKGTGCDRNIYIEAAESVLHEYVKTPIGAAESVLHEYAKIPIEAAESAFGGIMDGAQTRRFAFARTGPEGAAAFRPEVLDEKGADFLNNAENADLICMDELGFIEGGAPLFRRRVMERLGGVVPILGVLREKHRDMEIEWHKPIKSHPSAMVLQVSLNNRDGLPAQIYDFLKIYR